MMTISQQDLLTATIVLMLCLSFLLVIFAVMAKIMDELNQLDYQRIDRFTKEVKAGLSLSETIAIPQTAVPTQPATSFISQPRPKAIPKGRFALADSEPTQLKIHPGVKTKTRYGKQKPRTQSTLANLIRTEVTTQASTSVAG